MPDASPDTGLRPIELVIFDCDGVLVDTESIAIPIEAAILTELGWPMTEREVVENLMGKSEAAERKMIVERLGPGKDDEWAARYRERFDAGLADLQPVDGVVEALAALTLPTCVASSGSHAKMRRTLGRTGLYDRFVGRIFSADEVARGKPAPDLFLHAAARMGTPPAACAVVEDSRFGVQAARAAGMRVFGYAGGYSPAEWLAGLDTVLFDDMRKLPELIDAAR